MRPARGFIALIAVVIISSILMGTAASLSQGVFFTRFDGLNREYKRLSRSLADACIAAGLLKLADNYDYLVTTDPAYDPAQQGVPVSLGSLYGTDATCLLLGPTTTPAGVAHTRTVSLTARATMHGAWTTVVTAATVHDPTHPTGSTLPLVTYDSLREVP